MRPSKLQKLRQGRLAHLVGEVQPPQRFFQTRACRKDNVNLWWVVAL